MPDDTLENVPTVDPEEAVQRARAAGLDVIRNNPLNAEMPRHAQVGLITPNEQFYIRSNFPLPKIDAATWRLAVGGLVEHPFSLSYDEIRRMPSRSVIVTLECAGNGRSMMDPPAEGEQWKFAAVSTADWTGVSLVEILDRAGVKSSAEQVVFRSIDKGVPRGKTDVVHFERSLNLDWARNPDVILAYAMNGVPLPLEHGFPLRVIVPSWYGMASVKWLGAIDLIDHPFTGHYQAYNYNFERKQPNGDVVREPVTQERVRALITEPAPGERVRSGSLLIRGVAWSGRAAIQKVEVSVGGAAWQEARFASPAIPYTWQRWELAARADKRGAVTLRARATDELGQTQPEQPDWNRLGYGNNAVEDVVIQVD